MDLALWAIDAGAGEALLRQEGEWLLISLDAEWEAVPLESPAEAVRWSLSSSAVPVGRIYADLDQAVADVREASLAALGPVLQRDALSPLLPEERSYRPPPADDRRRAQAEFLGRALRRPGGWPEGLVREVMTAEGGRLERYFESRGHPPEKVLDLLALTFDRFLADPAGWVNEDDLAIRLFALARDLERDVSWNQKTVPVTLDPGDRRFEQLARRRMAALPRDVLETLATWTNLELGYWEIQVILQYSPQELEQRLRQAAGTIGLAAELLRVRLFAPACQRAASGLLARHRPR